MCYNSVTCNSFVIFITLWPDRYNISLHRFNPYYNFMETIYLGLVFSLFMLAIFDLWVGVSNDAVNFLNSAIGAKAASFRMIMIIAAIGIFCGAIMSNGMMDIARHGIFRPEWFHLNELMCIFLAVMVTDIILLDIFNSLGLPTSTTVSLVFSLLGGTTALTLVKLINDSTGMLNIANLMNTEKALTVIIAIFISVAIAFIFGIIVQFLSRLLFSFNYRCNLKWKIGIFGGIATTAIIYFILIKGVHDMSFMTVGRQQILEHYTLHIILFCLVFFTILMQILYACKVNIFRVIILLGTFALAMSFAGNDLVNFIGVPLAGFSSFHYYMEAGGGDPRLCLMSRLNEPAQTPIYFLAIAGFIMVISLMTSKKAHNVVKTSVDLARQDVGEEMFGSSRMARLMVRSTMTAVHAFVNIIPPKTRTWIGKRFNQDEIIIENGAAFDFVRASVNLVLGGLLIALGTSLKLPLSTTYVAFMVAMGTSLADRAWGRESAVFRITGVLSVIGGWFITAGAAFLFCSLITLTMYFGGIVAIILIIIFTIFRLVISQRKFDKKVKNEVTDELFRQMVNSKDKKVTWDLLREHVIENEITYLRFIANSYTQVTDGFIQEDLKALRRVNNALRNEKNNLKKIRRKEMIGLQRIDKDVAIEKNTWFHLGSNSCQQMMYCLRRMCEPCEEHVDNNFKPMPQEFVKEFIPMRDTYVYLIERAITVLKDRDYNEVDNIRSECDKLRETLSRTRKIQMNRMQDEKNNLAVSYVYLNIIQESQELISTLRHLLRAAKRFQLTD